MRPLAALSPRHLPVRTKLLFVVVGTCAVALFLAALTFSAFDLVSYRRSLVRELSVAADLVALNSTGALLFDDEIAADRALDLLNVEPSIVSATIYTGDGSPLGRYGEAKADEHLASIPTDLAQSSGFQRSRLRLLRPIVFDGERIGTIRLEAQVNDWVSHLLGYWVVVGPLSLMAMLGALVLASRLQALITRPISELASTARSVSNSHDYTVRARKFGRDELGLLADAFNDMLDRIEEHERLNSQAHVEALRESEERWRRLSEATFEGVAIHDDGTILDCNNAFAEMLGFNSPDVLGRGMLDFVDRTAYTLVERRIRSEGAVPYEGTAKRRDGTEIPIEIRARPMAYKGREVRVAVVRDLSETRRTEEALADSENQLRHAQKMDAVGRLAAGVAHDFNNLLTVIGGNGDLILPEVALEPSVREAVEQICQASGSAASLTRQLLAFSRQQMLQPKVLDLGVVVDHLSNMLRRLLGESIAVVFFAEEGIGKVRIDPGQIEQVIVNLAVNARDAMPSGGTLRLEIREVLLAENSAARPIGLDPGAYVLLEVSDTGVGMDRETASRAFEPFYTTKEAGRGTGLGLATVYGIVNQSGAYIEIESEVGRGTKFSVHLPVVDVEATDMEQASPENDLSPGSETVLLVEDDAGVRALARRVLNRLNYDVLEAPDGQQAILMSERYDGRIDLVLTDVVMPGMSGPAMAEVLTETRPEARILFMSGYTDDAILHHGVLDRDVEFLSKPFTPQDLATKIREVLDRAEAGVLTT